jgi:hypothetical protein
VTLLDDTDRLILSTLAKAAMAPARLGRRIGTCEMTAKRRARLLAARGLLFAEDRRFYSLTDAGREALGPDAPKPTPWVRVEAISAASSKDVQERRYVDDATSAERSRRGKMARASAKANGSIPFVSFIEFGMTG